MRKQQKIISKKDNIDEESSCYMKTYMFIKEYAAVKGLKQTGIALVLARKLHTGQYRNGGVPFLVHPLNVCSMLISYGIEDDVILAAALLHDILEDCRDQLPKNEQEIITEHRLSQEVFDIISLLTKESGLNQEELSVYFGRIQANPKGALIKLSDRFHNLSTLYTFSFDRMKKYIDETNTFLIPMAGFCRDFYPEYRNAFSILENSIYSMNHSMEIMMLKCRELAFQLQKSKSAEEGKHKDGK